MGKKVTWLIMISLVCSTFFSVGASAVTNNYQANPFTTTHESSIHTDPEQTGDNPHITITSPAAGYLYFFQLKPLRMTLATALGLKCSIVVGRSLQIDTDSSDIHHAHFIATRIMTGWETDRWDYRTVDGVSTEMNCASGLYNLTVIGYNETNQPLCQDSIKVLYLKVGQEDFGVWVNTKYNGGETISQPLHLGISDFSSMLATGDNRTFKVTMQSKDDTTVDLRFTRTKIMNSTVKVIESKCNVQTTCDSTKEYEVSVDVRFPFVLLDGGQPAAQNNPYFSTSIGYISTAGQGGANHVNTTFYVGRETLNDPRVFRLSVKPENIGSESKLTFFTHYLAVNATGSEVFQRTFTIDFEPATELTITSIPREAKISYEFGRSAGVPTKISLRAEGGALDDIVQSFFIDPMPSYMNFDLTILGAREFLYASDRPYNVTYALDSIQNGNLVTFQVLNIPEQIHATWGIDIGTFGDFAASSFADLNMSRDIKRLALYVSGDTTPFISVDNFPKRLRVENAVDLKNGTGNLTVIRGYDTPRILNISLSYKDMIVTKSFELRNTLMKTRWKIDLIGGTGFFNITRDSSNAAIFTTSITYKNWTFTKSLTLQNEHLNLSWNVDRAQRTGEIVLSRDAGSSPTLSFSLAHDGWALSDTLELTNGYLDLFWQLPTQSTTHAQIGLITGGIMMNNTISVVDNGVELLRLGFGIQTDDHYILSWDYANGQISNFSWSGKLLRLTNVDIAVDLIGDVFTLSADLTIGETGAVELQFNKNVDVTFADAQTDAFQLHGNASFNASRRLQISWALGDTGYFTVYTFGQPLGDQFNLEFGFDPQHTGNYQYGFLLTGQHFIEITRTIEWYTENGQLQRIWVLGDEPIPGDWTLQVLWQGQWYNVPWP
jgi:hypothetical protein